jgi:O-methyltransferase involved in polyketide biosynthesis
MNDTRDNAPDSTAARVALWRALHVEADSPPHVLEDKEKGARASGTPFLSFFTPPEILALARDAGFKEARHVSAEDLARRYFAGRTDGLRPPNNTEELLVANT